MSVSISLFAGAGWQFFDNNGVPLAGGLLYTYAAGTTTPQSTYTTSAGSIANANPIVLDSAGRTTNEIWLTDGSTYKFVLKNSTGTQIGSYDNIAGGNDFSSFSASSGSSLIGYIQGSSGSVATTVQAKLRQTVSVKDFGASPSASASVNAAAFTAALAVGSRVYVPAGTYALTGLIWPNKEVTLYGDGETESVLTTTSTIGIYIGHYANTYGSQNSVIQDIGITANAGTTGVRINNLGVNLIRCVVRGGSKGIECNSQIGCTWDRAIGYGNGVGIYFTPDHIDGTYNPVLNTNSVIQQNTFLNIQGSANSWSINDGNTYYGICVDGSTTAFMTYCSIIGANCQQMYRGFYFVGNSIRNCTFIGCWVESVSTGGNYIVESSGCYNTYVNFNQSQAAGIVAIPSFSPSSSIINTTGIVPTVNGGNQLGQLTVPSAGVYKPVGFNVFSNINYTLSDKLRAYGTDAIADGYDSPTLADRHEISFYHSSYTTSAQVATVTMHSANQISLVEIYWVGMGVSGPVSFKGVREIYNNSGTMSFITVGTDYVRSGAGITLTQVGATAVYTITITGLGPGYRVGGNIRALSGMDLSSGTTGISIADNT
jgi:hypothetical protein